MAKCEIKGFDDLLDGLKNLENADEIAEEILFEGGNILRDDMRDAVRSAANRGYATGELAASIIPTAPMKNAMGHFVAVRPVGTDSKGVRNGEKLTYLEHGTSRQQKRSELGKVAEKAEPKIAEKAQEIFDKHVKL